MYYQFEKANHIPEKSNINDLYSLFHEFINGFRKIIDLAVVRPVIDQETCRNHHVRSDNHHHDICMHHSNLDEPYRTQAFKIMKRSKNKILNLRRSLNRDIRLFGQRSLFRDLFR
ncbi:hypothetical protein H5410_023257 [Solanum commersonii]|uniref:Uncharacterized protein n=1 Tax=Solanum commersonii TaxID=4109 RepID=A0A9J5ZJ09_SOLCO|nr:hypothetical protein H5410_023257 [Solanum commersonii]